MTKLVQNFKIYLFQNSLRDKGPKTYLTEYFKIWTA